MIKPQRKRILYVENGIGYGGAVICLRHLLRNLDKDLFEPMVITGIGSPQYQEIAQEAIWQHIPDRRFNIVLMKRNLNTKHWPKRLPGLHWLVNQLLSRLDDLINFLPTFIQTLWVVIRFKPNLIHVNNEPLCNRAAILAGKLMRIPILAHVRGDQQGSLLMHSFFKLPDYFIAVSKWVESSIQQIGVPAEKRTYIYDGIETQKLDMQVDGLTFRRQHKIPEKAFVVGLVGMLIPWKGQMLFIEAAKSLLKQMPDAIFACIGGTPDEWRDYEVALKTMANLPELKERLVFTGHVNDMSVVYNGLDIVVSASTSPEPLGIVVMEAMTLARTMIAPDHGGAVEVIENGNTGLLFKHGNAQDLAEKILTLYQNPILSKHIGQSARDYALRTFSMTEHIKQVENVYRKMMKMR
ncbi:MAG: glycosyltransferase family 4 protein [Methylophilaceae bacterium]